MILLIFRRLGNSGLFYAAEENVYREKITASLLLASKCNIILSMPESYVRQK